MKLLYFGRLRDAVGVHEQDVSLPATVTDSESLRVWIGERHPALLDPQVRIAVDNVLAVSPVSVDGAQAVAFLPPVSGG